MPVYKVSWQTRPAVGSEFHHGDHTVYAKDDGEAIEKTKTEKSRHIGRLPGDIIVTGVSRGMP